MNANDQRTKSLWMNVAFSPDAPALSSDLLTAAPCWYRWGGVVEKDNGRIKQTSAVLSSPKEGKRLKHQDTALHCFCAK
jgi:hypothetical protein